MLAVKQCYFFQDIYVLQTMRRYQTLYLVIYYRMMLAVRQWYFFPDIYVLQIMLGCGKHYFGHVIIYLAHLDQLFSPIPPK